jgi:hypothetical protein
MWLAELAWSGLEVNLVRIWEERAPRFSHYSRGKCVRHATSLVVVQQAVGVAALHPRAASQII